MGKLGVKQEAYEEKQEEPQIDIGLEVVKQLINYSEGIIKDTLQIRQLHERLGKKIKEFEKDMEDQV